MAQAIAPIKISMWDILVTFLSGVLVISFTVSHLLLSRTIDYLTVQELANSSISFYLILALPLIFILGLLVDSIANLVMDRAYSLFRKDWKITRYVNKKILRWDPKKAKSAFKKIEQDIPKNAREGITSYFWANYMLEQKEIETPQMVFLSKYGFYRVTTFICIANTIVLIYAYFAKIYTLTSILWGILFTIFFGITFFIRSQKFYNHGTKAVLGHYLVMKSSKK